MSISQVSSKFPGYFAFSVMDDDYEDETGSTIEEDYYTFLNVPRNVRESVM